jgi:hypothetical protein
MVLLITVHLLDMLAIVLYYIQALIIRSMKGINMRLQNDTHTPVK